MRGVLAAGAIAVIPIKWAYQKVRYRLYGDGVTDDTEALQALLDGEPVIMPNGRKVRYHLDGEIVHLDAGVYRVTRSIRNGEESKQ